MKSSLRYIVDQNQATHVVLPIGEYEALTERLERAQADMSLPRIGPREQPIPVEVAQRIIDGDPPVKVWREYRELSVEQLASASKLSIGHLEAVESKRRVENAEVVQSIAEALEIDYKLLI